jgi:hypothetical protein
MKYFFFILSIFALTSCKVTFTERIRQQAENNKVNISKIQFYNSDKIVLRRTLSSNEMSVTSGKVKLENGKYTEIIKIKKHTRGKCESYTDNNLRISFEVGQNKSLVFSNKTNNQSKNYYELNPDNCKIEKKSSLAISSTNNRNSLPIETVEKNINVCTVTYDNKKYTTELPSMPFLLIKKTQLSKSQVRKRTVKGVKVD